MANNKEFKIKNGLIVDSGDVRLPSNGKVYLWTGHNSNFLQYNLWQASASGGMFVKNIASGGDIYFQPHSITALTLSGTDQNATFGGNLIVPHKIMHSGDTDNYHAFGTDTQSFVTGNSTRMSIANSLVRFNQEGVNQDFQIFGENVDNLFYVDASADKIGIGTASPAEKLEVVGNIKTTGDVIADTHFTSTDSNATLSSSGSGGNVYLRPNGKGTATGETRVNTSGVMVVNTTSTSHGLEVAQSTNTGYAPASILLKATQSTGRGGGIYSYNTQSDNGWYSGSLYNNTNLWAVTFLNGTSFDPAIAQTTNAILTVDGPNSRVGIGTTSPSYKLSVNSGTSDWPGFFKSTDDKAGIIIQDNDTTAYFGAQSSKAFMGLGAGALNTNLIVDGSGNVGIGTTSPQYSLHILEGATNAGALFIEDGTSWLRFVPSLGGGGFNPIATAGDIGIIFSTDNDSSTDTSGGLIIAPHSNTAGGIKIREDGKVGLGTDVPRSVFHISHATAPTFRLSRTGTGQVWVQSIDSSGRFQLAESASEGGTQYTRLQVDDTGEITFNGAYTFPTADGSNGQVLQTDGSGNLTFAAAGGGTITGVSNMANNRILTAQGATTINAESNFTFDGSTLTISGAINATNPTANAPVATFTGNYTSNGDVALSEWQRSGGAVKANFAYADSTTDMEFGTTTSHGLNIKTGNTKRLSITSAGNATFTGKVTINEGDVADQLVIYRTSPSSNQVGMKFDVHGVHSRFFGVGTDGHPYWSTTANLTGAGNGVWHSGLSNFKVGTVSVLTSSRNLQNIGTISSGAISSGNVTAGNSSTANFLRAHYSDGAHMTLHGYGLEMNRAASYIRPTSDNDKTLYIGGADASLDWNQIHFRSGNGLYLTGTRFIDNGRNLENIGSLKIGTTTVIDSSRIMSNIASAEFNGQVVIDADNIASGALRIEANQTNPDNDLYFAQKIVSNLSGSTTTTGDREQGGIFMDINTSATGGDISNEHRAYGMYIDLDSSGDADLVYGVYSSATATPTTGTTSSVVGVFGHAEDNGGAGEVSFLYGVRGNAISDNSTSDVNTMYGVYGKASNIADSATIGAARGVYGEIEIATNSGDIYGSSYVFEAQYDNNTTSAPTHTGALYYGNYAGTLPTTAYGFYFPDDVRNYAGGWYTGKLGLNSNPTYSFNGDTNTGMYSPANHELGFTVNGSQRLKLDATTALFSSNVNVSAGHGYEIDGTTVIDASRALTSINTITSGGLVKINASGSTSSSIKLLVGTTNSSSSSAIAQFGGFLRARDYIFLHDSSTLTNAVKLAYNGGHIDLTGGEGSNTSPATRVNSIASPDGTQLLYPNNNGSIMIGSTSAPGYKLDISGTDAGFRVNKTANDAEIITKSTTAGAWFVAESPNYYAGILHKINGVEQWAVGNINGQSRYSIKRGRSGTEVLSIKTDGKIGINMTDPSALLHIQSEDSTTNDVVNMMILTALSTGTTTTGFGPGILLQGERNNGVNQNVGRIKSVAEVNLGTNISSGLAFETSTAGVLNERLRITYDGKVGIGGTNDPSDLLTITGDAKYIAHHDGSRYAFKLGADSSGDGNFMLHDGLNGNVKVKLYAEANAANYINNGGNFGIGTSSPGSKLEVKSSGSTLDQITLVHSGNTAKIASLGQESSHGSLVLRNNSGVNQVRLSAGGNSSYFLNTNVGIGTSSPSFAAGSGLEIERAGIATLRLQNSNSKSVEITQDADFKIESMNSGADIILMPTASVGIGTASPSAKLQVENAGGTRVQINSPDGGGAPALTSRLEIYGYEGRGAGIEIRDSVNSASNANNREWFVGSGYGQSGFNIGYASDGVQSSYAAQNKLTIDVSGRVGIGTSSPSKKLHIQDSASHQLQLQGNNSYWNIGTGWSGYYQDFLLFATSSGEKMAIDTNGNVGIGVNGPSAKLHIVNNSTGDTLLLSSTESSSSAAPVLTFNRDSASPADADYLGQLKFKGENDADQDIVYAKITAKIDDASDGSEDGLIEFMNKKAGANVITARLKGDKLQLLNSTSLEVAGDVVAFASSDARLKDNVTVIDSALNKVKQIRGVEFDWNDKQNMHKGHDIGVIAQEVEQVVPELVRERDDGYKAVDYPKLTAVLIEAVKELELKVKELEEKLK